MTGVLPPLNVLQFEQAEYDAFRNFLRSACGIDLGNNKQYLVSTRVRRLMMEYSLTSLEALTRAVLVPGNSRLRQQVIDAMTTNETFWFRDTYPFVYLRDQFLPSRFSADDSRAIRVWSAACSTGQEPYSISMAVEEGKRKTWGRRWGEVDIFATDVSNSVLQTAMMGRYDKLSVARGLSPERARLFFKRTEDETWTVSDSVRQRVRFRQMNLQDSFGLLGKFDAIFCRNVLIYFSGELKTQILARFHEHLHPGGMLFLGSSENITGLNHLYELVNCRPGVAYKAK